MGWEKILKNLSNNPLGLSGGEIKEMFFNSLFDGSGFRPLEVGAEEVYTLSQQSIDEYKNEREQFGRPLDPIFEYGKPGDRFVQGSFWHTKGVQHPNGETYRFLLSFNHYNQTGDRGFAFTPNLVTDITITDYSYEHSFNPTQREHLIRYALNKIPHEARMDLQRYVNEWADSGELEQNRLALQRLRRARDIKYKHHEVNNLLEKVMSHPNYDLPNLVEEYNMDEHMLGVLKAIMSDMEVFPESPAFNEVRDNHPLNNESFLIDTLSRLDRALYNYFSQMATRRSYEWLESTARGMGVNLGYDNNNNPTFSHRGLNFGMTTNNLFIQGGNLEVLVCVVPTKELPIGDHFLALLGLVVARPEELDVVNFGIKLAEIGRTSNFQKNHRVFIYTPFRQNNKENAGFEEFLKFTIPDSMYRQPQEYKRILEEIQDALIDVFGDTRGFF